MEFAMHLPIDQLLEWGIEVL